MVRARRIASGIPGQFYALALAVSLAQLSTFARAQVIAPPPTGDNIVVNPTIDECKSGWAAGDETKWPKPQFDQFCAVLTAPAPVVINPTADQCSQGWTASLRWTKDEFEGFCAAMRQSK